MKPISFFVQGEPKAQPRPRAFARRMGDKFVARVYTPGTAEAWKSAIAEAARPFVGTGRRMIDEPIAVSLTFVLPRPKAHYLSGNRLRSNAPMFHSIKPDCDNLAKSTTDPLKTIGLIADDSLIVQLEVTKLYTMGQRIGAQIEIREPSNPFRVEGTGERFSIF